VNTYRPVVPLYESVAATAGPNHGWQVTACISSGIYRSSDRASEDRDANFKQQLVWTPRAVRGNPFATNAMFCALAPFRILGSARPDVNIFLTHPPLFYVLGGLLSRLRRVPYIVHVMDLYPEILYRAGWLPADNLLHRQLLERTLGGLKRAAGIVVIGRCMKERLVAKGLDAAKIHFVPSWPSPHVRPIDHRHNRFRERLKMQDRFMVMYSGNMGLPHQLETILSVAGSLVENPEIQFVFVGAGRQRGLVEAAIARGLPNVTLLDYQADGEDLAHSLSAPDVHFISLREGYEGLVVPSKFYGALAAGRPVVYEGAATGEIARVIEDEGCGLVIRPRDVAGLRAAILTLYADPRQRAALGATALELYRKHYTPGILADAYCQAIATCLEPQPRAPGVGA
jgi:colanic acid biosynthesis glycosyl transferase WcaI